MITSDAARARSAGSARRPRSTVFWAILITGVAQFMAALDNLVVTTALPVIRRSLGTGLAGLEWTVNAFTLTFAVFLLTGAALGDRFGRRRMFVVGLVLFTVSSAAAALAPNIDALVAARAFQGAGGALIVPLSLTLLSAGVPAARRDIALGIWGALGGLAVAVGPLVGGAVVQGLSWHWIFWINVPIGIALVPLARFRLAESFGDRRPLDVTGVVLASAGLFGVVFGLVRGGALGWGSDEVLAGFAAGAAALAGFFLTEHRSAHPMLPLRLFQLRSFSVVNGVSVFMSFGMFGSIFFLAQFLQTVQHYSPLSAGIRTLPWTAMPVVVAPAAGLLVERLGGRALDRDGARPAGGRARMDRRRAHADDAVRGLHPGFRLVRRRDVALFRPGRLRRPRRGAPCRRGRRLGNEQRPARTRRGARDFRLGRSVR